MVAKAQGASDLPATGGWRNYAVDWFHDHGSVRRHFRDASWSMRADRRLRELHLAITSASGDRAQELGRAPIPSEVAHLAHVRIQRLFTCATSCFGRSGRPAHLRILLL